VSLAKLALSRSRPLWVLDEPFTALDKAAVAHLQALIADHISGGGAIMLTTHQEVTIAAGVARRLDLSA
jgi:heme exporter protein A